MSLPSRTVRRHVLREGTSFRTRPRRTIAALLVCSIPSTFRLSLLIKIHMALLSVRDLKRQFDTEPVFTDVTFDVQPGDRIGLVGPNGTGKTTLMRILAGVDHEDFGEIEKSPSVKVAMLEQHVDLTRERTLFEEAKSGLAELYALQAESQTLANQFSQVTDAAESTRLHARYDAVMAELDRHNAHHLDHRVEAVLFGLGFQREQFDRSITQFSGGQQNRMLLARILLSEPDLMLLDEPTNHLDIAATEWLEDYLARSNQSLIVISHDRYFLDRVTNRTIELFERRANFYKGNFSAYWRQREERQEFQRKAFEKQQEYVARTEDFIRRNIAGQKTNQAKDRIKKLERVEKVELIRDVQEVPMNFGEPTRTGDWVFDAQDLSKGFGDRSLFSHFTMQIMRGDRIAILGPNGAGKTTLLRTLIGELPPDSGKLRFGTGVKLAYYDQQLSSVDPELNAVEAVVPPNRPDFLAPAARSLLARFGLSGDIVFQKIAYMSGGERSRVALAKLSAQNANVLTLDEPTNHLDLWARQSLEKALQQFDGTMIFVSHDRYFVDQLATSVIVFEPDGWHHYAGNYSDYVDHMKRREEERKVAQQAAEDAAAKKGNLPANAAKSSNDRPKRKRKFPYRKAPDIEREIAQTEQQLGALQDEMSSPASLRDGNRMKQIATDFETLQAKLAQLYEHWEEALELN